MDISGKKIVFEGVATALITPMRDGRVDYDSLGVLIDRQIGLGADAVVICGTTGEAPVLDDGEHKECIRFAVERAAGRIPVIAGTGSNDTRHAIEMSGYAAAVGADAILCVTPYYNKATSEGLVRSFLAIADSTDCPMILYNVPSRTGVSLTVPVLRRLAAHERIVALKDASGDVSLSADIMSELGGSLMLYSGNDELTLPLLSVGASGVISVVSNLVPQEMHDIWELYRHGRHGEARRLQMRLMPLIRSLQSEVNPIPVKTACAMLGLCGNEMRLPLCGMDEDHRAHLSRVMSEFGLIG